MVYGDGHDFLTNFTGAIDVIGHELTVSLPILEYELIATLTDLASTLSLNILHAWLMLAKPAL